MRFGFRIIGVSLFVLTLIIGCGSPRTATEPAVKTQPGKGKPGLTDEVPPPPPPIPGQKK
jgi:hypothetical protein